MGQLSSLWIDGSYLSPGIHPVFSASDDPQWYVVALDSSVAPFSAAVRESFAAVFARQGIRVAWDAWGFWVSGREMGEAADFEGLMPPFSALYLFTARVPAGDEPPFAKTTEQISREGGIPADLASFISRSRALAYIADGDGVYIAFDNEAFDDSKRK